MTIDGLEAGRIERPSSIEELSKLLRTEKGSVVPIGGGTQLGFGNPLRSFDCAVDLTALNRITEYVPADLTIHVEAGVRLGDLQRTLAENSQFIPLDPFNGSDATIGGIAATNAQGAFRTMGTIRDWIIGMKVVEADGTVSKTGGRVVKNVTGYDLAKLYTGSIGTLSIISEISLKVRASYGRDATVSAKFTSIEEAGQTLAQIRTSPLQPVSCEWRGPENEIWLRFGEHPSAVEWQLKNLPTADWRIVEEPVATNFSSLGPIVLKVVGLPTQVVDIVQEFKPKSWVAHAANGIVLLSVSNSEAVLNVRKKYRAQIERAPLEIRQTVGTFGISEAEYAIMRKMKDAFDPHGRLNPGRHVDGEHV